MQVRAEVGVAVGYSSDPCARIMLYHGLKFLVMLLYVCDIFIVR